MPPSGSFFSASSYSNMHPGTWKDSCCRSQSMNLLIARSGFSPPSWQSIRALTQSFSSRGSLRACSTLRSPWFGRTTLWFSDDSASKVNRKAGSSAAEDLVVEEGSAEHEGWAKGGGLVHKLANVDSTAIVEVGAVVHEYVQVGPHSHIGSGSILGPHVTVGSSTTLWYNVSLRNCSIGDHCIIHNGVCIGQDGFGFFVDEKGQMVKKPQMLRVKIGDHVEIGANTCIDRGSWRDTVIGDYTKIDNQVQIGHNVIIGQCCMLCGQVGLGGSSTLGEYVVLGGKVGVADHVSIVSKVRIAAKSGVTRSITEPGDYAGFPAVRAQEWRKSMIAVRKLGRLSSSNFSEMPDSVDKETMI